MKTTATCAAFAVALAVPALFMGCKPKPVESPAPVSRNFTGLWQAKDKSGAVYTVRFFDANWESHIERDGAKAPYYRGTYTFSGSLVDLRVLEEADPVTLQGWVPEKGNFPKTVSGRLVGGRLKVPALTEAELVKKN